MLTQEEMNLATKYASYILDKYFSRSEHITDLENARNIIQNFNAAFDGGSNQAEVMKIFPNGDTVSAKDYISISNNPTHSLLRCIVRCGVIYASMVTRNRESFRFLVIDNYSFRYHMTKHNKHQDFKVVFHIISKLFIYGKFAVNNIPLPSTASKYEFINHKLD